MDVSGNNKEPRVPAAGEITETAEVPENAESAEIPDAAESSEPGNGADNAADNAADKTTSKRGKKKKRARRVGVFLYTVAIPALSILLALAVALAGGPFFKTRGFTTPGARNLFGNAAPFSGEPGFDKNNLSVYFFYVGQGDAALVLTPDGRSMLIDAGTGEYAPRLAASIKKIGVKTIDWLVLTHPHGDHVGGAEKIFSSFAVSNLLVPDAGANSPEWLSAMDAAEKEGCPQFVARPGDLRQLSNDCSFTVLGPFDTDEELNNCSVVMRVDFFGASFLFTGDCEKSEERSLLLHCASSDTLRCSVLKVGHHGSSDASSPDFLSAVRPAVAVVSCGKNNDYGHPALSVLGALRAAGCEILRTDVNGTVLIQTDGSVLTLFCEND